MKIQIEKKGWVYIILCFIITSSATNTSNNSLFMLSAFMLSILLISGVLSTLNLMFLRIEGVQIDEVYAKRISYIKLKLKPQKYLPLSLSVDGHRLKILNREILYPLYFPKRGLYKLPRIRIESNFPFGFIKRVKIFKIDEKILVFPSCKNLELPTFKLKRTDGKEQEKKHWGEILEYYGIKPYQEGDDPRYIHWKKTAQKGEIVVKEFETSSRGNMQLFLDTHIKDEDLFEEEVERVAGWCCRLLFEGKSVSLLTPENFLPEGSGEGQRKKILSFLGLVKRNA
ncbi:MAG: DUF58 domain-containing protein [Thermoanaerobaculia bacterium]